MKRLLLSTIFAFTIFSATANAQQYQDAEHDVHVRGYDRKDGTHVNEHYRSHPHRH